MSDHDTSPYPSSPGPAASAFDSAPEKNGAAAEKNGWGLAALITGLVALIGAAIPILNYGSWIVALAGIALGIVALVVKNKRRGAGIAGLVLSVIALILSVLLAIVYTVVGVRWITDYLDETGTTSSVDSVEAIYEVIGDGDSADIQYIDFDDGRSVVESEADEDLPFEESVDVPLERSGIAIDGITVTAVAGRAPSTLSCRIVVDGTVVDEQTDSGPNAEVTCSTGN